MRLLELQGVRGDIQCVAAYATINNLQPGRSWR